MESNEYLHPEWIGLLKEKIAGSKIIGPFKGDEGAKTNAENYFLSSWTRYFFSEITEKL